MSLSVRAGVNPLLPRITNTSAILPEKRRINVLCSTVCLFLALSLAPGNTDSQARELPKGTSIEEDFDWIDDDPQLAPFVPTPMEVVKGMLDLAGVTSGDVVYDLGSGDGRIVITAAKEYGVRAIGFEIDPDLVRLSRINVANAKVAHLVEIREENFVDADFSPATVVTMYLLQESNLFLRPLLRRQLRPGARIVSHRFDMDDWEQDDDRIITGADGAPYEIYLWRIKQRDSLDEPNRSR